MTRSKTNPSRMEEMFGKIAGKYDTVNSVMSFQMHKLWNQKLTNCFDPKETKTLLDLCAGTGEIGYRWLKKVKLPKKVIFLDVTKEMLEIAKDKKAPFEALGHEVSFIEADAAEIPLEDVSLDGVSVAYGIRNIERLEVSFKEVFRTLKPGGTFAILELTEPKNKLLKKLHIFYLNHFVPFLGKLLTKEAAAYEYLAKSIQSFTKPEIVKKQLEGVGFSEVEITPLTFGVATLIKAKKQ